MKISIENCIFVSDKKLTEQVNTKSYKDIECDPPCCGRFCAWVIYQIRKKQGGTRVFALKTYLKKAFPIFLDI